jgi:hypothetical protein
MLLDFFNSTFFYLILQTLLVRLFPANKSVKIVLEELLLTSHEWGLMLGFQLRVEGTMV